MVNEYGYEYDAVLDEKLFKNTYKQCTHEKFMGATCLRSGRDALKVIAREFKPTLVLIPALACDSMIRPFVMYGHKIKYYKLNNDYSIDIDSLKILIRDFDNHVLFLYMDYFGNKAIEDNELRWLKNVYSSMIFIEDRTHNLFAENSRTFLPDYTVASLRKWLDIPDGGLLWNNRKINNADYGIDLTFSEVRLKAQCMRNEFLSNGDEKLKHEYRRIFSTVTDIIDKDPKPGLMSLYAYKKAEECNVQEIYEIRKRNAKILIDELNEFDFVQNKPGFGDVYVAILINNRDTVQKKLASMGIFCTIIWPLNDEQKNTCDVAKYTEEHMLTIYCDQRYNIDDVKYAASCIRRICNE